MQRALTGTNINACTLGISCDLDDFQYIKGGALINF